MGKQASVVLSVLLLFAGVSSAAIVSRHLSASSRAAAAVQHEKRLGPKPTPGLRRLNSWRQLPRSSSKT